MCYVNYMTAKKINNLKYNNNNFNKQNYTKHIILLTLNFLHFFLWLYHTFFFLIVYLLNHCYFLQPSGKWLN